MADYINPTAIRPDNGWKPQGFLGGMYHSRDRQRYEDVSSLQDYMMKNQAVESGGKLQDYLSDAPVRESKRLADLATNMATAGTVGDIKRNEVEKGKLDNQLSAGTLASKIAEAAAKASQAGDTAQMQQLANGAAIAKALAAAAGNGPGALAGVLQQLEQSKADPRIIQWFKGSRSPQELMQKAQMINDAFLQANQQYRSTMDANKATLESREREGAKDRGNQMAIAQLKQKDKLKSIDQMLQEVVKLSPDKQIGYYDQVIADGDATLVQKEKARTGKAAAVKALNLNAKTDDPILPGLPPSTRRRYGDGPGSESDGTPPVIDFNKLNR